MFEHTATQLVRRCSSSLPPSLRSHLSINNQVLNLTPIPKDQKTRVIATRIHSQILTQQLRNCTMAEHKHINTNVFAQTWLSGFADRFLLIKDNPLTPESPEPGRPTAVLRSLTPTQVVVCDAYTHPSLK